MSTLTTTADGRGNEAKKKRKVSNDVYIGDQMVVAAQIVANEISKVTSVIRVEHDLRDSFINAMVEVHELTDVERAIYGSKIMDMDHSKATTTREETGSELLRGTCGRSSRRPQTASYQKEKQKIDAKEMDLVIARAGIEGDASESSDESLGNEEREQGLSEAGLDKVGIKAMVKLNQRYDNDVKFKIESIGKFGLRLLDYIKLQELKQ
ncbi:hypothetical protein Syun_021085 [Stephania yunnanensis]|uniref:Uncharacterized protein n=1 Tax=Stephania yunnanensis TaxID=152371 RepID=A0AAP0IFY0_9MAGN